MKFFFQLERLVPGVGGALSFSLTILINCIWNYKIISALNSLNVNIRIIIVQNVIIWVGFISLLNKKEKFDIKIFLIQPIQN